MTKVVCDKCGAQRFGLAVDTHTGGGPAEQDEGIFVVDPHLVSKPDYVEVSIHCMLCGHSRPLSPAEWEFA